MANPYTLTAVRKGQLATFAAADNTGWIRQPVPADGVLVETDTSTVFVPVEELQGALAELVWLHPPKRARRAAR